MSRKRSGTKLGAIRLRLRVNGHIFWEIAVSFLFLPPFACQPLFLWKIEGQGLNLLRLQ